MVDVIMLINAPSVFSTLWSAIKGEQSRLFLSLSLSLILVLGRRRRRFTLTLGWLAPTLTTEPPTVGMLDKVTESKVKVFGSSKSQKDKVEKYLRSFIDPKLIPKEFGGDSEAVVPLPLNAREMGLKA